MKYLDFSAAKLRALKTIAILILALSLPWLAYASSRFINPSQADSVTPQSNGSTQQTPDNGRGYGIAGAFDTMTPEQLNRRMADIRKTGATWVRYDLSWNAVQFKGPNSYDWSVPDRITAAARANGLNVLMIPDFTPPHQRVGNCVVALRCAPVSPEAYADFVAKAAAHYTPYGVNTWEIWNEPNISFRFGPGTDPAKYTQMLKGAYTAIKKVNPNATVIAANTAPAASEHGDLRPIDFLREMYNEGAQGHFDAIATHPYTYPLTPSQSHHDDAWGQMKTMHDLMAEYGDGDKKIWITEFGAPTNGRPVVDDPITEAAQAQTVTEAITIFRSFPWSGGFFWYNYQDSPGSRSSENFFGLTRLDGSPKPSYDAFVQAIKTVK